MSLYMYIYGVWLYTMLKAPIATTSIVVLTEYRAKYYAWMLTWTTNICAEFFKRKSIWGWNLVCIISSIYTLFMDIIITNDFDVTVVHCDGKVDMILYIYICCLICSYCVGWYPKDRTLFLSYHDCWLITLKSYVYLYHVIKYSTI